jgi:L-lactate dehydrogenase complex protein LldF
MGRAALRWSPRFLLYGPWNPWGKQRELPEPGKKSFRKLWKQRKK